MNSSLRRSALMAATAMLAACGGGGSDSPVSPPSGSNPPNNSPSGPPGNPPFVNDAEQYRGYLEASLRIALGIDHIAKTIYSVPAKIKADVEAHGPFTQCQHAACPDVDTSQWTTFPFPGGGTVRLMNWQENPSDGVLASNDHLHLDLVGIGNPSITTTAHLYTPGEDGALTMNFVADHELTRHGLSLSGNTRTEWTGSLRVKPTIGGYEIRDRRETDTEHDRQLIITEHDRDGGTVNVWLTNYFASTQADNLDAVALNLDMFNYLGGGNLKLRSESTLAFGQLNGKTVLQSGRYIYEYRSQDLNLALRVSVDPDPAYVDVEIDETADGTYEKAGRLLQADFDLAL